RVDREPRRNAAVLGRLVDGLDVLPRLFLLADRHHVALLHAQRRGPHVLAVQPHVAVRDQLPRVRARVRESAQIDDVVEPPLEQLDEVLARVALLAVRELEQAAELALEDAVDSLGLLLLAKLVAVLAALLARPGVLTRRVGPLRDRALHGLAAGALEEEL